MCCVSRRRASARYLAFGHVQSRRVSYPTVSYPASFGALKSGNEAPKKSYDTGFLSRPVPIRVSGVRGRSRWAHDTINIVYPYFSLEEVPWSDGKGR